jgi:hypothetical protein
MADATRKLAIALMRAGVAEATLEGQRRFEGFISEGDIGPLYEEQARALMKWAEGFPSDVRERLTRSLNFIAECFPGAR